MIDLKYLIENTDKVKEKLKYRLKSQKIIDEILELYEEKRKIQQKADEMRHLRKKLAKDIGILKSKGENIENLLEESNKLNSELELLEQKEKEINENLKLKQLYIPNIPKDEVPDGPDETYNKEIKKWGHPRNFNFKPKPHYELGESLKILDFERGAKIAGSGFTLYNESAAKLERALINFMLDVHTLNGYKEKFVPFLIKEESLIGTGQLPKFKEDLYKIENDNLYLNPTAEVPLTNIYRDEIIPENALPIWITAYAPSFRLEAGSYGKDTRGIIRQHQFNKVELVKFCKPEDSEQEHQTMLEEAEKILQLLNLPYRVVILSSGDMGFSAAKCYDIEVWIPSMNQYKEISSVSNCLDFQARRANIKFKRENNGKTEYVHTLNGSGLAVGRTLVAILENYQEENGEIKIPEILLPYTNNLLKIKNNL